MDSRLEKFLLVFLLTLFFAQPESRASSEGRDIAGHLGASQDEESGIFVSLDLASLDKDDLQRLRKNTQNVEFVFYRGLASEKNFKIIRRIRAVPRIFDKKAAPGVWYQYKLMVIINGRQFWVKTNQAVKGYRPPSDSSELKLDQLYAYSFRGEDSIRISVTFLGEEALPKRISNSAKIHWQYANHLPKDWTEQNGFYEHSDNTFREKISSGQRKTKTITIPKGEKDTKIWLAIRYLSSNGSSLFFLDSIPIKDLKIIDRAVLQPELEWRFPSIEKIRQGMGEIAENSDRCYGLSFVPYEERQTSSILENHPAVISVMDQPSLPVSYFGFELTACQSKNDKPLDTDCPINLSLAVTPEKIENRSGFLAADYQIPSGKIKFLDSKFAIPRDSIFNTETNNYSTLSKFYGTTGYFVWREIYCNSEADHDLILRVQKRLYEMGYYFEKANGHFNVRTKAAITNYQKALGLPIGNLDKETVERLGL